jgi:hypothetical protein
MTAPHLTVAAMVAAAPDLFCASSSDLTAALAAAIANNSTDNASKT